MLYKPSRAALRPGDRSSKPGPEEPISTAAPEPSELQKIASLRRGTASRQIAFRAARRRARSRRSKVAASAVPLLVLGSAAVPAIAFATTGGGPSKAAPSTGSRPAAQELAAFDGRPSAFGGDWSTQTLPAWVPAPTTSTTQPAAPPTTTGTAAVVSAQGRYLGTFVVTCYDLGGHTATGTTPTTATVAVDPRIIPLGTRLNISGVGERIAQDTGGAIRGDRLDIWEPTYGQCAAWGVQDRQVWIG